MGSHDPPALRHTEAERPLLVNGKEASAKSIATNTSHVVRSNTLKKGARKFISTNLDPKLFL